MSRDARAARTRAEPSQPLPLWLDEPPDGRHPLLVTTRPQVLPFEQLSSEDFERLLVRLLRIDAEVEHCQLYGTRGEAQHGIDLYARRRQAGTNGRPYVTVQCRNVAKMTASHIASSIKEFLDGDWATMCETFVIASRVRVRGTRQVKAIEAAAEALRQEKVGFEIWDGEELSHRLRALPDLVESFFGPEIAKVFCTPITSVASETPSSPVQAQPSPSILPSLCRWLTARGAVIPVSLNLLRDTTGPHSASHRHSIDSPPSVRVGFLLPAGPIAVPGLSVATIRRRFIQLLQRQILTDIVSTFLPSADPGHWHSFGDTTRASYAAILSEMPNPVDAPSAWARLRLPTPGEIMQWRDGRTADFIINIEWPGVPSLNLRQWRDLLDQALAVPDVVRQVLTDELGLPTLDEPSPSVGVWLSAPRNLLEIVDVQGIEPLPGSIGTRWFNAYAIADFAGREASEVAREWINELADEVLNLDRGDDDR